MSAPARDGAPRWRSRALRVLTALALIGLMLGLWAFVVEPASLRTREAEIALAEWPPELDGLRVAVLADLHVGSPWNGRANLRRVVRATNRSRPDLVLIPGDLVIQGVVGGDPTPPEQFAADLARLRAPLGVYGVLGNHDWWHGAAEVAAALRSAGVVMLEDASAPIRRGADTLWLAGVSDLWEGAHDIDAALADVPPDAPTLLFTHNPDLFPDVPERVALTIAGHTHGGQVALPFIGRPIVPSSFGERFAIGHVREGTRDLFVSSGVGTSILPVRFRVPPEVSVVTLRAAP